METIRINTIMDFGDSRLALFEEPNAYIQKWDKCIECEPKKVVFSEPYENVPNFYLDHNFKKGNCDCGNRHKPKEAKCSRCDKPHEKQEQCSNNNIKQGFGFDLKNLLPLLGMFGKSGGSDLGKVMDVLGQGVSNSSSQTNLISSILSNKELMNGVLNLFKGGRLNLFNNKPPQNVELKTTDFEIKNYTRVE